MRRPAAPAAGLLAAVLLAGCTGTPAPGRAQIDVDTPELRALKAEAGVADCEPVDPAPVEGGLPAVTLPCFGGGPDVAIGGLRGPLVVNLWASWCGPCREEMPILQQFHERYGDRVPLIGIDYQDSQPLAAMELARDSGVSYPLLADPQSELRGAAPFPGNMGLPMFAFVDESGDATVVAAGIEGVEELRDLVEEHLEVDL